MMVVLLRTVRNARSELLLFIKVRVNIMNKVYERNLSNSINDCLTSGQVTLSKAYLYLPFTSDFHVVFTGLHVVTWSSLF